MAFIHPQNLNITRVLYLQPWQNNRRRGGGGAEAEARRRRRRRAEVEALTRGGERAEADALRRTGGGRRRGEVVFFRQHAAAFSGGLCRGVRGVGREGRGGERSGGEGHAARRHSRSGGWRTKGANVRRRKTVRGGWLRSLRRGFGGGMRRRKASDLPPPLRCPLSLLRGADYGRA